MLRTYSHVLSDCVCVHFIHWEIEKYWSFIVGWLDVGELRMIPVNKWIRPNIPGCFAAANTCIDWWLRIVSGWWFGTFFIFPYIGNNQLTFIFFRGVQTTNQVWLTYQWKQAPKTSAGLNIGCSIRFSPWLQWSSSNGQNTPERQRQLFPMTSDKLTLTSTKMPTKMTYH